MAREKEAYRDNLERINERFPDKEMLTPNEVAAFLGRDPRTVRKYLDFGVFGISKAALARAIS